MHVLERPSPHFSSRGGHRPGLIVVHGDAGTTDEGTVAWMQRPESKVSYHYLVGRDGTIYRFVGESKKAWHAGPSSWTGYTVRGSVNPTSIGVCFANDAEEPYRLIQYQRGGELVADISRRYGITPELVRGHHEVSPGRKTDPWDHFDWGELFRWFGLHATGRAA